MSDMIGRRSLLMGALSVPLLGAAAGESPLRIGVLSDLTGPLAQQGKRQLLGAQHRAGSGGHGHGGGVELMPADAAETPEDAVFGLLEQGVHGLILLSSAKSIVDAANASCTPALTTGKAEGPYVFQAGPSPGQVAQAMMQALKTGGVSKAGVMSLGDPPPDLADAALNRGITLTGAESFDATATDLTSVAATLIEGAPEAIVVAAPPPFDGYAARDARAAGFTGPIMFPPSAVNPGFHGVAGPGADGSKAVAPWAASAAEPPADLPNATVIRRFKEGFTPANGAPGASESMAADAVALLQLAFLGHRDRKQAKAQLDQMCCVGVCGVYNPQLGDDALTVLTSADGAWG